MSNKQKGKQLKGTAASGANASTLSDWLQSLNADDQKKQIDALQQISKWAEHNSHQLLDGQVGGKISHRLAELLVLFQSKPSELLMHVISCIKHIAATQVVNDFLREIGVLFQLKEMMSSGLLDAKFVSELGTAAAFIQKCTPFGLREIGFGFDSERGNHAVLLQLKQLSYEQVGVAWRVWDGSILLSRWIYQNKDLFAGKVILELGAGCGLCGLVASIPASKTVITDCFQDVVTVLKENVTLNEKYVPKKNIHIALLDFKSNEILANPAFLKNQVDVIIGSEIMYEVDITEALMKTINMYLKPNGHFYGISASYRKGLQTFLARMPSEYNYTVETTLPGTSDNIVFDTDEMTLLHAFRKK